MRIDRRLGALWLGCVCAGSSAACSARLGDDGVPVRYLTAAPDGAAAEDAGAPAAPTPDPFGTPDASGAPPSAGSPDGWFTGAEWQTLRTLSPLPAVPRDPTNKYADDPRAAALGQQLFFDKSWSGALAVGDDGSNGGLGPVGATGRVSCASCHLGAALDDRRSTPNNVSLGIDYGSRKALPLVNASFYPWSNWAGKFDSQWSLTLSAAENPKVMKGTRLQIAHAMWSKYRAEYDAIFAVPLDPALDPAAADAARFPATGKPKALASFPDGPWEAMTEADREIVNVVFANYGKAIAAYERKLVSRDAPFDRYVAGDFTALSEPQRRGLRVFLRPDACIRCHSGPTFTDGAFHRVGLPQTGPHVPAVDFGRYDDLQALLASPWNSGGKYSDDPATGKLAGLTASVGPLDPTMGAFRTKGLRGVTREAPYMHAGQFATLAKVLEFYATATPMPPPDGGPPMPPSELWPIAMHDTDAADLEAFLGALDGAPIPSALTTDTSK
jgi:cytochrome c peroxidase